VTTPRLSPSIFRHDAYTLSKLARHVASIAQQLRAGTGSLHAGGTVVDFGAGDAPYRTLFEADGVRYIACDLDASAEVQFKAGEPVPLANGVARVVVSFQVLEHVWDLDAYLGEAKRLMADDGVLVLSTHGTWLYHPHPTDFRRWTRDGLVAELTTRGFIVDDITGLVGPLAWTTQFRALGFHHLLVSIPLIGGLLAGAIAAILNTRMAIEDRLTPVHWVQTNAAVYVLVARKSEMRKND
jgi:SAM-dependent methyltransferase